MFSYRCTRDRCRARKTSARELYIEERVCRVCGGRLSNVNNERRRVRKRENCHCNGLPFAPHSIYSYYCKNNPIPADQRPEFDEEDAEEEFRREVLR